MYQTPIRSLARRGLPPGLIAVVLGVVVSLLGTVVAMRDGGGDSASASGGDTIASVALLVPDDRLDPRIVALEFEGADWHRSVDRLDAALFAAVDNDRKLESSRQQLNDLETELLDVGTSHRAIVGEIAALSEELIAVEAILRARALDRYVHFGDDTLVGLDDPGDATDAARSVALGQRVDEVQFSTREDLLDRLVEDEIEDRNLKARAVELGAEIASTQTVVAAHVAEAPDLAATAAAAADAVRSARLTATIPGVDLSVVALDAYLNAEAMLAGDRAGCGIRWWMIAGVARIESIHGRFGGRTLRADGRVDRPIIGIALDGGPGVRAMVDTDGGEFDADTVWDRAVGPLQFIPETWSRRGRDASGDGYADPQNIYDAALSAGRYLCALGGDLSSRAGLRSALMGYNNSSVYGSDVLVHADRYAEFALPSPAAAPDPVGEDVENPG